MPQITLQARVIDSSVKWDSKGEQIIVITKLESELGSTNMARLAGLVNQDVTVTIESAQLPMFDKVAER